MLLTQIHFVYSFIIACVETLKKRVAATADSVEMEQRGSQLCDTRHP